jgi:SNF2 family DNA or RNA helicase
MEQEIELPCEMTDEQKEAYEELCLGNDKDAIDAYISICGKSTLMMH